MAAGGTAGPGAAGDRDAAVRPGRRARARFAPGQGHSQPPGCGPPWAVAWAARQGAAPGGEPLLAVRAGTRNRDGTNRNEMRGHDGAYMRRWAPRAARTADV